MAASSSTTSTVWLGKSTAGGDCTRTSILTDSVYPLKMRNERGNPQQERERDLDCDSKGVPRPSPQFRRRAWLAFQRALDPLAHPKPLRGRQQR